MICFSSQTQMLVEIITEQIGLFLFKTPCPYIWDNQFDINIPYDTIKQRLIDTFLQCWYASINNSPRLQTYRIFKHSFKMEKVFRLCPRKKIQNCFN
jgi:hypothetical protein